MLARLSLNAVSSSTTSDPSLPNIVVWSSLDSHAAEDAAPVVQLVSNSTEPFDESLLSTRMVQLHLETSGNTQGGDGSEMSLADAAGPSAVPAFNSETDDSEGFRINSNDPLVIHSSDTILSSTTSDQFSICTVAQLRPDDHATVDAPPVISLVSRSSDPSDPSSLSTKLVQLHLEDPFATHAQADDSSQAPEAVLDVGVVLSAVPVPNLETDVSQRLHTDPNEPSALTDIVPGSASTPSTPKGSVSNPATPEGKESHGRNSVKKRCSGLNGDSSRCKNHPNEGDYCYQHKGQGDAGFPRNGVFFEFLDRPHAKDIVVVKVGMTERKGCERLAEHRKHWSTIGLKMLWPDGADGGNSTIKPTLTPFYKQLEKLVKLELADLSASLVYLEPNWRSAIWDGKPACANSSLSTGSSGENAGTVTTNGREYDVVSSLNIPTSSNDNSASYGSNGSNIASATLRSCPVPDCLEDHKELFRFRLFTDDKRKGEEWDRVVKPVIERWERFMQKRAEAALGNVNRKGESETLIIVEKEEIFEKEEDGVKQRIVRREKKEVRRRESSTP
ncbi:hypothetical protein H0H92_010465 [Tricholoma furcatifolium]|nr:hypothetical protein H0H92_010465 [Tricholoma furcatifolium]